jgi:hypothetical protein
MITCPRCAGSAHRVYHPRLLERLLLGRFGLHRFFCYHCRISFYRFSGAVKEPENQPHDGVSEWPFVERPDFGALIGEIREAEKEWGVGKRRSPLDQGPRRLQEPAKQEVGEASVRLSSGAGARR